MNTYDISKLFYFMQTKYLSVVKVCLFGYINKNYWNDSLDKFLIVKIYFWTVNFCLLYHLDVTLYFILIIFSINLVICLKQTIVFPLHFKLLIFIFRNLLISWEYLFWRQVQKMPPMWNRHLWQWQLKSRGEWVHQHLLLMHLGKEKSSIQVHLLKHRVVVVVKNFFKHPWIQWLAFIFQQLVKIQALWLQFTGGRRV